MRKKAKVLSFIMIVIMFCTSITVYASSNVAYQNQVDGVVLTIDSNDILTPLINSSSRASQGGPIYIGDFYDENSQAGYVITEKDGKKCKLRLRHIKKSHTEDYLYNSKFLMSLYRGQSKSVSETITDSKTTSVTRSVTTSLSAGFKLFGAKSEAKVSTTLQDQRQWTHSYTISTTDSYTFPSDVPAEYSYVNLYSGFTHDMYEAIVDYVPYETYDKKTKVTSINVTTPPPYPDDDPFKMVEYDVWVHLADGRTLHYNGMVPPHHAQHGIEDSPEVQAILSKFDDGYHHEYTSGYNFNNREEFTYDVKIARPTIKWDPYN